MEALEFFYLNFLDNLKFMCYQPNRFKIKKSSGGIS